MEQSATVKALFKAGRSAKDTFELLHAGYGEQATVYPNRWYKYYRQFKDGQGFCGR